MTEYIALDALLKYPIRADHYDKEHGNEDFILGIESVLEYAQAIPAADVAPVVHGEWEGTADGYADGELVYDMWNCSECGFDANGAEDKPEWNYCPVCGARMNGGCESGV